MKEKLKEIIYSRAYQRLFEFMANEHSLILIDSEMDDIIDVVQKTIVELNKLNLKKK